MLPNSLERLIQSDGSVVGNHSGHYGSDLNGNGGGKLIKTLILAGICEKEFETYKNILLKRTWVSWVIHGLVLKPNIGYGTIWVSEEIYPPDGLILYKDILPSDYLAVRLDL